MTTAQKPITRRTKAAKKIDVITDAAEEVGPTEVYDPVIRNELKRAAVWIGLASLIGLLILLIQPILLIIGGLVLAAMLDGGARLLGRVLPIPRGFRLALVVIAVIGFLYWTISLTGSQLADQALTLRTTVQSQIDRIGTFAQEHGFVVSAEDVKSLTSEAFKSVGRVTEAVTSAVGIVTSLAMMLVLAIFLAADPRMYERGIAWMLPLAEREHFYATTSKIGFTLRRLMFGRLIGMTIEGVGTWFLLSLAGVPMAALLGVLTGILAFLPNIGALISGVLMILVGFSAGTETGLWAIAIYVGVHLVDGWLISPMVAKKSVDLAPAMVLSAQLLFGALFGVIGLALADPIVVMIKVALERQSERNEARHGGTASK
jgi:predicted PurR-regulated permease PerM